MEDKFIWVIESTYPEEADPMDLPDRYKSLLFPTPATMAISVAPAGDFLWSLLISERRISGRIANPKWRRIFFMVDRTVQYILYTRVATKEEKQEEYRKNSVS